MIPRLQLPKRTVVGLVLATGLLAVFLFATRLRAVKSKADVGAVLSAGPLSFREHVVTVGMPASEAWLWQGWNLWMGNAVGMTFAILIGAALSALVVPEGFLARILSRRGARGSLAGGALGSALFMCANCATPVSMGYYRRGASLETALALTMASPMLNIVAVVTIILFFPMEMAALRIGASALAVVGVPALVVAVTGQGRSGLPWTGATPQPEEACPVPAAQKKETWLGEIIGSIRTWIREVAGLGWRFIPWMLLVTWLMALLTTYYATPDWIRDNLTSGIVAILLASTIGTLFVTSTMLEIPIVVGLLVLGVGVGPATTLLVTLPATSLMAAAMMGRDTGWRVPGALLGAVWLLGVGVGLAAEAF